MRIRKLKYVPPEDFARARDRVGAKNVEIARELGVSPTRVTELTRTKGGTSRQYARLRQALATIKAKHRGQPGRHLSPA